MSIPARSQTATVPFWERLQQILAYPLNSEALLTITLLAVLRLFGFIPGPGGWIVSLVLTAATFKYAAEVLSSTANGNMEAPSGYATPDSLGWVILKVLLLLALALVLIAVVLSVAGAPDLIWIAAVVIAVGTPAAMMSAAIDQDTFGALSPAMWWATITRIGWPYFGAAILCLLLLYSEANARQLLLPFLPGPLGIIGHYFISNYVTVVTFHLLGYLVYQYRDVLGYELKPVAVGKLLKPRDRDQSVLDQSEKLAADGDTQGAARALFEHLNERGGSDLMHRRLRKLLHLHADREGLDKHARQYLNVMIAQEKWPMALEFWSECRSDTNLWPSDPDQVLELVDKAREHGKPELILKFASGFSQTYPKHTSVAIVHLRVAQALAGPLGNRDDARRLLESTLAAYPRSKAVPEIEAYLGTL